MLFPIYYKLIYIYSITKNLTQICHSLFINLLYSSSLSMSKFSSIPAQCKYLASSSKFLLLIFLVWFYQGIFKPSSCLYAKTLSILCCLLKPIYVDLNYPGLLFVVNKIHQTCDFLFCSHSAVPRPSKIYVNRLKFLLPYHWIYIFNHNNVSKTKTRLKTLLQHSVIFFQKYSLPQDQPTNATSSPSSCPTSRTQDQKLQPNRNNIRSISI